MAAENAKQGLWVPGWYELDQPLAVGSRDRFWFFQNPPMDYPPAESVDYVFYNQITSGANCQVRYATIVALDHHKLGPLERIDTDGLDYIFFPRNGPEIVVNAEEDPGAAYESQFKIEDWTVQVTMMDVSEPVADYV